MADAYDEVLSIFREYGLQDLAQVVIGLSEQGYTGNALTLQLQESDGYKQRFAGNTARAAKGLAVLSPAEYLSVEAGYRQAFDSYGLSGFADTSSELADLIAKDIAPNELVSRIQLAGEAASAADPEVRNALKTYYGVGDQDLVGYFLDETKGTKLLEQQATASQLGAVAKSAGLALSRQGAENLYGAQVNRQQAAAALGDVNAGAERGIAARFGEVLSDDEIVRSEIGVDAVASGKRKKLASQERALFGNTGQVRLGTGGRDF